MYITKSIHGVRDMSEFTPWVACNRLVLDGVSGTNWVALDNAEVDNVDFSYAPATGAWSNSETRIVNVFTDNLSLIIPSSATIDSIETRFYFELPQDFNVIPQVNIFRSNSLGSLVENIGFIGPSIQTKEITWSNVSPINGDDIVAGTAPSMYMKCQHSGVEEQFGLPRDWQLNMRYVDIRVEFTRAPNVPRTAYIGLF